MRQARNRRLRGRVIAYRTSARSPAVVSDRDPITGLPDDLDLDDDLARTGELVIRIERRRYDKPVTIVEGFARGVDLDELATTLKKGLGTGGTVDDGAIELQGDHRDRLPDRLGDEGFTVG